MLLLICPFWLDVAGGTYRHVWERGRRKNGQERGGSLKKEKNLEHGTSQWFSSNWATGLVEAPWKRLTWAVDWANLLIVIFQAEKSGLTPEFHQTGLRCVSPVSGPHRTGSSGRKAEQHPVYAPNDKKSTVLRLIALHCAALTTTVDNFIYIPLKRS